VSKDTPQSVDTTSDPDYVLVKTGIVTVRYAK
jgi:hypothetical protein